MKKKLIITLVLLLSGIFACAFDNTPAGLDESKMKSSQLAGGMSVNKPEFDTEAYAKKYKKVTKDGVIMQAMEMMQNLSIARYSYNALMGNNLTEHPFKIEFKNIAEIRQEYASFDALGWKKKNILYIYINPRHADAPPAALAALLAHEALHQDEFNSLAEETYAWTMEAAVWTEMLEIYPEQNDKQHPLLQRENTLKQLFKKGGYTNKYIKKTVYANKGYQNLPQTSPGFERL